MLGTLLKETADLLVLVALLLLTLLLTDADGINWICWHGQDPAMDWVRG